MEKSPVGNFEFRRNNFDLLRLLAATEVLVFHAKSHLDIDFPAWADKLWYFRGVPVFSLYLGFSFLLLSNAATICFHIFGIVFFGYFRGCGFACW